MNEIWKKYHSYMSVCDNLVKGNFTHKKISSLTYVFRSSSFLGSSEFLGYIFIYGFSSFLDLLNFWGQLRIKKVLKDSLEDSLQTQEESPPPVHLEN